MNYIERNFHKWKPVISRYRDNNRLAVVYMPSDEEIEESADPSAEAIATINLPDVPLLDDEVIIKDYSENEGIYAAMLKAGHIGPELRTVTSGHIIAPVCKLLLKHTA